MSRFCFRLQVDPTQLAEYRRRHAAVWPEMQEALRTTGWRNYSLFLGDDGLLIGYVEPATTAAEMTTAMAATDVNARWQEFMKPLFAGTSADDALVVLEEVFHLS